MGIEEQERLTRDKIDITVDGDNYTINRSILSILDLTPCEGKKWRDQDICDAEVLIRGGYWRAADRRWIPVPCERVDERWAGVRKYTQLANSEKQGQLRLTRAGEEFIKQAVEEARQFQQVFAEYAGHMDDKETRQRIRSLPGVPPVLAALAEFRDTIDRVHDNGEISDNKYITLLNKYMDLLMRCHTDQGKRADKHTETALKLYEINSKEGRDERRPLRDMPEAKLKKMLLELGISDD